MTSSIDFSRYRSPGLYTEAVPGPQLSVQATTPTAVGLFGVAVGYRTESLHGAGSPQAQRIMIARQGNIEQKKELAKAIAGIPAGK